MTILSRRESRPVSDALCYMATKEGERQGEESFDVYFRLIDFLVGVWEPMVSKWSTIAIGRHGPARRYAGPSPLLLLLLDALSPVRDKHIANPQVNRLASQRSDHHRSCRRRRRFYCLLLLVLVTPPPPRAEEEFGHSSRRSQVAGYKRNQKGGQPS